MAFVAAPAEGSRKAARVPIWSGLLVLAAALAVPVAGLGAPGRAKIGEQTLVLNGQGTRERLGIEVYELALYLPQPTSDPQDIRSAERTKALRYEMRWPGPVPEDHPERWKEELLPVLTDEQVARLRENLSSLDAGDVMWIYYVPGQGTTVKQGDTVLVHDPSDDVMQAYLDLWLGEKPLSGDLRDALLAGDGKHAQR